LPNSLRTELNNIKRIKGNDNKMRQLLYFVINNVRYIPDKDVWRVTEYWQTPKETWSKGTGDCEDGAILLYACARYLGIDSFNLKIVAGWVKLNNSRGGHAYLVYLSGAIGLAVIAGGLGGALIADDSIEVTNLNNQISNLKGEVANLQADLAIKPTVITNVTTEYVDRNITVEVPVENETFIKSACDKLLYDDVSECKEEVDALDAAIGLAVQEIKDEFADEIQDAGIIDDEDDVNLIEIKDDFEDIKVLKEDFDDDEYRFEIKVEVEDDDNGKNYDTIFTVEVEDGDVKIKDVVEE
jgi:hypothetical protein